MAYTFGQEEKMLATGKATATSGTKANWWPGYKPHIIRGVSAAMTAAATTTGAVVKVLRGTIGLTGSLTTVAILNLTTLSATKGTVITSDNLNVQVDPGQEIQFRVTTKDAGGAFVPIIYTEIRQELPGNITSLVTTT